MKKLIPALFAVLFLFISLITVKAQNESIDINLERAVFNIENLSAGGGGPFVFSGSNSSLVGTVREGYLGPAQCNPCLSGNQIYLNSVYAGELSIMGGHPGMVNGTLYNTVYYSGSLNLSSNPVTIPNRFNRAKFTLTQPATLTGVINGYPANIFNTPAPMIFTSQLNLNGTVTVTLVPTGRMMLPDGARQTFRIVSVKYDFSTASNISREDGISN